MVEKELTLYRDEHQSHEVTEWPMYRLVDKLNDYIGLAKNEKLMPRQKEEARRLLGRYAFEFRQRDLEMTREHQLLQELSRP